jgi:hypothetical protein
MIQLKPLKNNLEDRATVLRVYRSVSLEMSLDKVEWSNLCQKINETYKQLGGPKNTQVNQRSIFCDSKYRKKVNCYPAEFVPVMINIIKESININDR